MGKNGGKSISYILFDWRQSVCEIEKDLENIKLTCRSNKTSKISSKIHIIAPTRTLVRASSSGEAMFKFQTHLFRIEQNEKRMNGLRKHKSHLIKNICDKKLTKEILDFQRSKIEIWSNEYYIEPSHRGVGCTHLGGFCMWDRHPIPLTWREHRKDVRLGWDYTATLTYKSQSVLHWEKDGVEARGPYFDPSVQLAAERRLNRIGPRGWTYRSRLNDTHHTAQLTTLVGPLTTSHWPYGNFPREHLRGKT